MELAPQKSFRPLRRVLRLGDRGPRVRELQKALARLNFYSGPPDGIFGYLTQDAVEHLQKEFGLLVDGIAGPMVWRLLSRPGPRMLRLSMLGENRKSSAGRAAFLIGYVSSEKDISLDYFQQSGRELTALAFEWWNLGCAQNTFQKPSEMLTHLKALTKAQYLPVVNNFVRENSDPMMGTKALINRTYVRRMLEQIHRVLADKDVLGIMFRFGQLSAALGPMIRKLLRDTRKITQAEEKFLLVSVYDWESPQNTLWGLPWSVLTDLVDYVVLEPKEAAETKSLLPLNLLEDILPMWVKKIPSWQLIQGIPVGGVIAGRGRLSYNQIRTAAYRKKASITWDFETMSPTFHYQELNKDGNIQEVEAWYENGDSLAKKLLVIQRYKTAGIMLLPLGYEDNRTWEVIKRTYIVGHF